MIIHSKEVKNQLVGSNGDFSSNIHVSASKLLTLYFFSSAPSIMLYIIGAHKIEKWMHTLALYHAQIKALQPKSKHTKGYCKNICWYVQVLFSFFLFFYSKHCQIFSNVWQIWICTPFPKWWHLSSDSLMSRWHSFIITIFFTWSWKQCGTTLTQHDPQWEEHMKDSLACLSCMVSLVGCITVLLLYLKQARDTKKRCTCFC